MGKTKSLERSKIKDFEFQLKTNRQIAYEFSWWQNRIEESRDNSHRVSVIKCEQNVYSRLRSSHYYFLA